VRTYTKRLMVKVRINRQSELFVLYNLTLSPFHMGLRDHLTPNLPDVTRIHFRYTKRGTGEA
jgi:hypothetical protein